MKTPNKLFIACAMLSLLYTCDDVLEEDISKKTITTLSPIEGAIIQSNTIQFTWEELKGAADYRIQIANANKVGIVDSLITTNSAVFTLNPGAYEWRIKGRNFAYETVFIEAVNFSVEESTDLQNQRVNLRLPSQEKYFNAAGVSDISFRWDPITTATYYKFELIDPNEDLIVIKDTLTTETFIVDPLEFKVDGKFTWRVTAFNSESKSELAEGKFYIDKEAPGAPGLTLPADQDTVGVNEAVTFSWTEGGNTGTAPSNVTYIIQIALDEVFNAPETRESTTTSVSYTFINPGTYYWRVIAEDQAGNQTTSFKVRTVKVE